MAFFLFADNGAIWKRGRNLSFIFPQIQNALENLSTWANNWDFRLSNTKSEYMIFGQKKKMPVKQLQVCRMDCEKLKQFKFGSRNVVRWLNYLGNSFWENFLQMWEDHESALMSSRIGMGRQCRIIASIISISNYGCMAYGLAASSVSKKLDIIQAKALRFCSTAFWTTPILSLLIEMSEMPLKIRRFKLVLKYLMKIKGQNKIVPTKTLLS